VNRFAFAEEARKVEMLSDMTHSPRLVLGILMLLASVERGAMAEIEERRRNGVFCRFQIPNSTWSPEWTGQPFHKARSYS
jgi:hypothetical protein